MDKLREDFKDEHEKHSINENENDDIINIGGIPFKNVHMPLDEYAKKVGAIPYNETKISGL